MEAEFANEVAEWHDFYAAIAGAAATLLGLLFVSLALSPAVMRDGSPNGTRVWAGQTFHNFLVLLAIAFVALIPNQTSLGVGIPLVILGVQGAYRVVVDIRLAQRDPDPGWSGRQTLLRFASPVAGYALCIWAAVLAFQDDPDAMAWLIPVIFLLVMSASSSCWDLLRAIGNQEPV
jgi:tryptophan-rich sensory protein